MADTQLADKQPTKPSNSGQTPALPEHKSSSWILILWILIPILFLIGITVFRSN